MLALLIIVAIAAGLLVAWLVRKSDPLDRLVARCYGDRELAERLVARERERHPTLAERVLIDRAIERLADDRRR